jgi:predicted dinucleotide-binding enzyme
MKIGVLGTGMVGQTIASKLVAVGHEVRMGSREAANPAAQSWAKKSGPRASHGTFADAAAFGEIVFNCTNGAASLDALKAAGASNLKGKVLVDVSNPLDFSRGMPPSLFVPSTDSLGERIQNAFPEARVVKALNTVSSQLMVNPGKVGNGEHTIFMCGNDGAAKDIVRSLLRDGFGWQDVMDVGDITTARGAEAYVLFWTRLFAAIGAPDFNVRLVRS